MSAVPADVVQQWFAIQVKPRCEKLVATVARNKGFCEFLPVYKVRRRWSDRFKVLELPLFPGYVFCRVNTDYRLPLLTIPGVIGFVGLGKTPLPIAAEEIDSIQAAVASGLTAEPLPYFATGERVRLLEGPLAGLEGVYLQGRKQDRIVVSVTLLQRSMAIEIDRAWVAPVRAPVPFQEWRLAPISS